MNKEQALAKIKELEEYIENLDKKDTRWKPSIDELYWYVRYNGNYSYTTNTGTGFDKGCYKLGNCFPSEELAKSHALRLEAMANRWKPNSEDKYYYWDFKDGRVEDTTWADFSDDYTSYIVGNVHKSRKEAEAYGAKFDKAFRVLWEEENEY